MVFHRILRPGGGAERPSVYMYTNVQAYKVNIAQAHNGGPTDAREHKRTTAPPGADGRTNTTTLAQTRKRKQRRNSAGQAPTLKPAQASTQDEQAEQLYYLG